MIERSIKQQKQDNFNVWEILRNPESGGFTTEQVEVVYVHTTVLRVKLDSQGTLTSVLFLVGVERRLDNTSVAPDIFYALSITVGDKAVNKYLFNLTESGIHDFNLIEL